MTTSPDNIRQRYTCNEYRQEMILAALQRSLMNSELTGEERERIEKEIRELEQAMGL